MNQSADVNALSRVGMFHFYDISFSTASSFGQS